MCNSWHRNTLSTSRRGQNSRDPSPHTRKDFASQLVGCALGRVICAPADTDGMGLCNATAALFTQRWVEVTVTVILGKDGRWAAEESLCSLLGAHVAPMPLQVAPFTIATVDFR